MYMDNLYSPEFELSTLSYNNYGDTSYSQSQPDNAENCQLNADIEIRQESVMHYTEVCENHDSEGIVTRSEINAYHKQVNYELTVVRDGRCLGKVASQESVKVH